MTDAGTAIQEHYLQFCIANHAKGSGAAKSYVTAINKLDAALRNAPALGNSFESVWNMRDCRRLTELYKFVKIEQKKQDGGIFKDEPAKSYWQQGFCSAAVKEFARFLVLTARQEQMMALFRDASDGAVLARNLDAAKIQPTSLLLDCDDVDVTSEEGKTAIREVEVRQNQDVFRRMVLDNYRFQCCLTGLPVAEVLRASHISPWAADQANRLNPANGLCLAATYDAAFDRYLISFDEDFRLLLAPALRDYCIHKVFQEQFCRYEGQKIALPRRFYPSQELLAKHRKKLA